MPDLYYDQQKQRYFVEKRVPKEVLAIIGKSKFKHTFPKAVDHATAKRLTRTILAGWEDEWDAARRPSLCRWCAIRGRKRASCSMRWPWRARTASPATKSCAGCITLATAGPWHSPINHPGVVRDDATGGYVLRLDHPEMRRADASKPADTYEVITAEMVIAEWRRNRERDPTPKAVRSKERAMRRLFGWLNAGHTDLAKPDFRRDLGPFGQVPRLTASSRRSATWSAVATVAQGTSNSLQAARTRSTFSCTAGWLASPRNPIDTDMSPEPAQIAPMPLT